MRIARIVAVLLGACRRRALMASLLMATGSLALAIPTARAEDHVKISVFEGTFVNLPIYVAQELHIFEKHGVKAELIYGKGIQVTNIMVSGAADFGAFAVEHAVLVASKGQDVRLLVLNQTQPPFALVVRNGVPTPNAGKPFPAMLRDLKGLKISISSVGASSDLALRFLLPLAGLDPQSDVKLIPSGDPASQVAALKNGLVDAMIGIEPAQTEAVLGLKIGKSILDLEKGEGPGVYHDYAYNAVFTRQSYLDSHAAAAKAVVASVVEAETIIADPARIDDVMKAVAVNMRGLDQGLLKEYVEHYREIWRPVATRVGIENVNTVLMGAKQITEPVPYDTLVARDYMPTEFAAKTQ